MKAVKNFFTVYILLKCISIPTLPTNENWFLRSIKTFHVRCRRDGWIFKYLTYYQCVWFDLFNFDTEWIFEPAETLSCNTQWINIMNIIAADYSGHGYYSGPHMAVLWVLSCILPTHGQNQWISKTVLELDMWTRDSDSWWCSRGHRCADIAGGSLR